MNDAAWSTVQPNTLPPKTSGAIFISVFPRVRLIIATFSSTAAILPRLRGGRIGQWYRLQSVWFRSAPATNLKQTEVCSTGALLRFCGKIVGMTGAESVARTTDLARVAGFDLCGVAPAEEFPELAHVQEWL